MARLMGCRTSTSRWEWPLGWATLVPVRCWPVEAGVAAALPGLGQLVDVLRHQAGSPGRLVRRIFAQFADGAQLDLAVIAEGEVRDGALCHRCPSVSAPARRPHTGRSGHA